MCYISPLGLCVWGHWRASDPLIRMPAHGFARLSLKLSNAWDPSLLPRERRQTSPGSTKGQVFGQPDMGVAPNIDASFGWVFKKETNLLLVGLNFEKHSYQSPYEQYSPVSRGLPPDSEVGRFPSDSLQPPRDALQGLTG